MEVTRSSSDSRRAAIASEADTRGPRGTGEINGREALWNRMRNACKISRDTPPFPKWVPPRFLTDVFRKAEVPLRLLLFRLSTCFGFAVCLTWCLKGKFRELLGKLGTCTVMLVCE